MWCPVHSATRESEGRAVSRPVIFALEAKKHLQYCYLQVVGRRYRKISVAVAKYIVRSHGQMPSPLGHLSKCPAKDLANFRLAHITLVFSCS